VELPDNMSLGRNSQGVSINGARPTQNNFEINGIDANSLSQLATDEPDPATD